MDESVERILTDQYAPTPALGVFLAALREDSRLWWRVNCGHHLNLFEAALDEIQRLRFWDQAGLSPAEIADIVAERDQLDREHAKQLAQALGERYEPSNRDEWERSFAEMLPLVKSRSDAWRSLLARIEEVDPAWLEQWRARVSRSR
jgi:DNA-binding transcriptional MerR regulator